MKQYIILVTLLIIATISYAQVGIGTSSPASSSQLDVTSTTKGLLPPRMTTSQRNAISSPATGLQIYNTDNRAIETFTGTTESRIQHYRVIQRCEWLQSSFQQHHSVL